MSIQDKLFQDYSNTSIYQQSLDHGISYLESALTRNVFPTEQALSDLSIFNEPMPTEPSEIDDLIDQLVTYGSPATVSSIGGSYFGFVQGSSTPAGIAAKIIGTFWDQNTAMGVMSPICSKLEAVVEKWLIDIFNLPEGTVTGFVSGSSTGNLCAIAAARYRVLKNLGWDVNEDGLYGAPRIRIITSAETHSTIIKAIGILGLGRGNIEYVDVDKQGRIILDSFPVLDQSCIVLLQAGNLHSGDFDPFDEICDMAKEANAWVHIDGAFGLWAGASQKLKYLTKGMEKANSWATDGHKTLNTPYDCGMIMCADSEALSDALHLRGGYIIASGRDGMFYTPEMSRRSRIIELWATLKYLGTSGIDQMVYGLHERAVQFANEISQIEGFHVLNDITFNQIVICCDTDELTTTCLQKVQNLRICWAGISKWHSKTVIRISISAWTTTNLSISNTITSFKTALISALN